MTRIHGPLLDLATNPGAPVDMRLRASIDDLETRAREAREVGDELDAEDVAGVLADIADAVALVSMHLSPRVDKALTAPILAVLERAMRCTSQQFTGAA